MAIQARCHLLLEVGIQDEQSVLMIIPSDSASDALSEVGIQDDQSVLMIIPSDNGRSCYFPLSHLSSTYTLYTRYTTTYTLGGN